MAKQVGPFFISGTIQGISFYKSGKAWLVRRAGGPGKKQIQTSPHFERTRYNLSEFAACSANGAFMRRFMARSFKFNDNCMYRRFTQLLTQLKNYDTVSPYGTRCISKALKHKPAKDLFCGFNFNTAALSDAVSVLPTVNNKQEICFAANSIAFPRGANKVVITALHAHFDFNSKQATGYEYSTQTLSKNNGWQPLCLKPLKNTRAKKAMAFYFLQLRFFCNELPFANGKKDVVACIAIDPPTDKVVPPALLSAYQLPFAIGRQLLNASARIKPLKISSHKIRILQDDSS
ncbi:MAG: hypothetical protein JNJ40_03670 [Bacteroidia bacterium]|nr:hypothetical protein [Bacteroidia bacterium]